jgi:hypothetical protein
MHQAHVDISRDLDGESVVFACFDLREDELAAAARAVAAVAAERYRTPRISADQVLELRELTALADELGHGTSAGAPTAGGPDAAGPGSDPGRPGTEPRPEIEPGRREIEPGPPGTDPARPGIEPGQGIRTMVLRPARLSALRDAVAAFVESRDAADWIRVEDREPLAILRSMLSPLEQLCADAMRAALSPESHAR